ncbi:MAG: hypothetical protein IPF54_21835 [Draconibacterium sp.]|nr:hypothetical protein [Draconibacterium sp.]
MLTVFQEFAVALENPVAENIQEMKNCITEYDRFCYESGLKSINYGSE